DGIYDPTYISVAKQAAEGDYATSVGAPTDQLPTAKAFVDAYNAAKYPDPYSAYGAYAYDAANVIINALAQVLPDQKKIDDALRPKIRQAVQDGSIDGVTGKVSFDQFGDTTTRILTVYQVQSGAWKPLKTEEFKLTLAGVTPCPAARQRDGPRSHHRADRPRLHDGLRDHPAHQLRPRRDLHD